MMHLCHWPGCRQPVPPYLWGCRKHWFKLPIGIRKEVWETYVPGQEERKDPTPEYLVAAAKAEEFGRQHELDKLRRAGIDVDQIALDCPPPEGPDDSH